MYEGKTSGELFKKKKKNSTEPETVWIDQKWLRESGTELPGILADL